MERPSAYGDPLAKYPDVMKPREVADVLRVEASTLVRWLGDNHIPGFQIGPKQEWRIWREELREYLHSQRNTPTISNDSSKSTKYT
ncbi:helix-turn-helix domain-containing protein [Streptomyces triculaminicus]|uniref:Helix-turn-helix domain-containing protein n=2 Tax=Streptomyces TaxID=1883 RepID=A0A939FL39_9ACTN|nr:helix-turn-helix domain-containing protein [Streptomyces triculaminicus]